VQQARNVSMCIEDEGIKLKYLIRDGDGKFSNRFDEFFGNIIKDNDQSGKSRGRVITGPVPGHDCSALSTSEWIY